MLRDKHEHSSVHVTSIVDGGEARTMLTRTEASCAPALLAAPTLSGWVPRDLTLCARLISSALALAATSSTSYQLAACSTLATSGTAPLGTGSGPHEGVPTMPAPAHHHCHDVIMASVLLML